MKVPSSFRFLFLVQSNFDQSRSGIIVYARIQSGRLQTSTKYSTREWATLNCTDSEMNYTDYSVPVTQDYFDNYVLEKSSGIEEVRLDQIGLDQL